MIRIAAFLIAIFAATSASADPISALIVAGFATVGVTVTVAAVTGFLINLGLAIALTALSRALAPKRRDPGLTVQRTLTGEVNPVTFMMGRSATGGSRIAPLLTHGPYLTKIIALSVVSGQTLNRVVIDGEWVTLDGTPHVDYGTPPTAGKYVGKLWVKYYDGTQTVADPMLVSKYGSHPDYPWPTTSIGTGVAYAICTFLYDNVLYRGEPTVRFEMDGIPLYDPRLDSTAGGVGSQRWATKSTWTQSDNPVVQIYNLLRGVAISGGAGIYGGGVTAADVPYSSWSAAMAVADATVTMADATTQPAYRAGFEVRADNEPLSVIDELLKTASADVVNSGGYWKIRVGAVASSILSITDDDIIISEDRSYNPFPGLSETFNGITAQFPDPALLYASRDAPSLYNSAWETEDGGRRLVADLSLPAVPYPDQVQRLMLAYIRDARRFRRHTITLPPMAVQLEPLVSITVTSTVNGYISKTFEVAAVQDDLMTMLQTITIRERVAEDNNWVPAYELPTNPAVPGTTPVTLALTGFGVTNATITDGTNARRPAIKLIWNGNVPLASGVDWEIRRTGAIDVISGRAVVDGAKIVSEGILPGITYEARAIPVSNLAATWTNWISATADNVRLDAIDLVDALKIPAVPTGLTLSTSLVADGRAQIVATWTASANAVQYEVGVTILAGNEVMVPIGAPRAEFDVLPGDQYSIRVRSISAIGTKSAWTTSASITAASDSTAPAVPTGLTPTSGFQTIWLKWTANTETDLSRYEISESAVNTAPINGGGTISYRTSATQLPVTGLADNTTKYYWIRAVDTSGNLSNWSAAVTGTSTGTSDFILTSAQLAGLVQGTSFAAALQGVDVVAVLPTTGNYEGRMAVLTTDGKIYRYTSAAWSKAVDGVDLVADTVTTGALAVGAATAKVVASNEIITVSANILNGVITDAKITDLSAIKITVPPTGTGMNPAIEVGTTGVTIGTVQTRSDDPAARVNAKTTLINPGLITVSGATTLADWRKSGDLTKIDGGALSANTIALNKATIGMRGIVIDGIQFAANDPITNKISWTAGKITYTDDTGTAVTSAIAAGDTLWTVGTRYVVWTKAATVLWATNTPSSIGSNGVIIATYNGGTDMVPNYGRTVIDGDYIKTATISAIKLNVTDLSAITANLGTISVTNANIANLTVGTNKITDNAASTSRYAAGTNDQSITWTPAYSGIATIWLFFTLSMTHSTAATIKYQIKSGATVLAARTFSAIDISPGSETLNYEGNVIARVATVAGTAITITADYVPGGSTSSGTAKLIVLEMVK